MEQPPPPRCVAAQGCLSCSRLIILGKASGTGVLPEELHVRLCSPKSSFWEDKLSHPDIRHTSDDREAAIFGRRGGGDNPEGSSRTYIRVGLVYLQTVWLSHESMGLETLTQRSGQDNLRAKYQCFWPWACCHWLSPDSARTGSKCHARHMDSRVPLPKKTLPYPLQAMFDGRQSLPYVRPSLVRHVSAQRCDKWQV